MFETSFKGCQKVRAPTGKGHRALGVKDGIRLIYASRLRCVLIVRYRITEEQSDLVLQRLPPRISQRSDSPVLVHKCPDDAIVNAVDSPEIYVRFGHRSGHLSQVKGVEHPVAPHVALALRRHLGKRPDLGDDYPVRFVVIAITTQNDCRRAPDVWRSRCSVRLQTRTVIGIGLCISNGDIQKDVPLAYLFS